MIVRYWNFSSGNKKIIPIADFKSVLGKLWELARSHHTHPIDDIRWEHFLISMLIDMQIHHKIPQGPFETCPESFIKYKSTPRSEEHTSELQSRFDLVCRLLLEKKKKITTRYTNYI